jgi:selenocysteine lyase/cysteine desulfurase
MIYLDHAATSWPKPDVVVAAVQRWYHDLGVSADRGDSRRCSEVAREVGAARAGIGALVGMPAARVAFTSGATESLNLFLRAALCAGDTVVTTAFEHSSVVRPLRALQQERQLRICRIDPDTRMGLSTDAVEATLASARARLFVFTHASNVTGAVFDAAAFCELARAHGCLTLLDASQTAGYLDLRTGADAVAGSAHKALHGPPGLGFLAVREGLDLPPQKQGGTGSAVALERHPTAWPTAFEAGTPNTPAILGLAASLRWLAERTPARLLADALVRADELIEGLRTLGNLRLVLPPAGPRTPVFGLVPTDMDTAELGSLLDQHDVHVRTGFHCAPWIHAFLGTGATGTVRMSPGPGLTAADTRAVLASLGCRGT